MAAEQVDKVKMLTDRISPILHGHNAEIQGAVLAELLATWLAGHVVPGDRMQTILLRGRLVHEHMKVVRDLMSAGFPKVIVEPYPKLSDAKVALTAWSWLYKLPTVDQTQIVRFFRAHYDPVEAPERGTP